MNELLELQISLVEDDCCPHCRGRLQMDGGQGSMKEERWFYVCTGCGADLTLYQKADGTKNLDSTPWLPE